MKNKRHYVLVLAMLVLTLIVSACGSKDENANNGTNTGAGTTEETASASLLDTIKKNGKIRIGTEGTYAPFTYHDQSGELTGFDVELAREVAKRLGVEAEFIETKWDGMFAGLDAKRFDMVANEVSINDERKAKYDFSNSYIVSKAVLIVNEATTDINSLADLKGKKSGQSLTSNLGEIAKANGAEIVEIEGFNQAIELLLSKRIDATINDSLSFLDFKKQKPDAAIKVVAETDDASESAFLFNKGDEELVNAVNDVLQAMKDDGTYLTISEKYFGEDVSK
ncbi:cystine transport system substrate-binding protein [Paenibacillus phyllosphaerae]|uniref:Cystine transport system substrate-binding protein n=1 Tax=Paenibacillus phyllosphaerae TaxID=274593 RepID=A0A7W5AVX3_9BACL|nr:amino acid ABC transporter substrate-binding protein [Paenibacillus phyllosphaerae]MBB3109760.1 cystine transport system substrate-binding protein [Paenibacillus phyllosphaerae]